MKKIIFLILFVGISLANTAPYLLLKGQVVDAASGNYLPGVHIVVKGTNIATTTDKNGNFEIRTSNPGTLTFTFTGYQVKDVPFTKSDWISVKMKQLVSPKEEEVISVELDLGAPEFPLEERRAGQLSKKYSYVSQSHHVSDSYQNWNTENYATIHDNIFHTPQDEPLSTFSIDVDVASYANMRRFIMNGQRPPKDAIRIEELINYFNYDYPQPKGDQPFSVTTELIKSPWNENQLLHVGLQGKLIAKDNLPPSNLVFLIDVSGSMGSANKLPLLKSSFKLLVNELREEDRVAIVVYAGAAGLVLPSTPGNQKETIISALDNLQAGGSTAGGAGIKLAYNTAAKYFIEGGNNRVIIATDGDFNIGESSDAAMERLISQEKERGTFLTVLGFGMGNYKDSKMEILADKGNGNYAYIDTFKEANKVLSQEFGGTLFTIAKDVKIQIEFNPGKVKAYRLIGYVNRVLQKEDFNNDKKDAGDLGSGHSVTALYEIIPADGEFIAGNVDPLKYQDVKETHRYGAELSTLKLRYKLPDQSKSRLITHTIKSDPKTWKKSSVNLQWAASVAAFGMYLRESQYLENCSIEEILTWANAAKGEDENGYRREFIDLVKISKQFQIQ